MRFHWQHLKRELNRAGAWCALFWKRLCRAVTGRLVLATLLGISTLWFYSRYVTELNFFVIIDQGKVTVHETYTRDAGEALEEAGIHISQFDRVSLPGTLSAGSAVEIEIFRACDVTVTLDGVTVPVTCLNGRVWDALDKAGYVARANDIIHPEPSTPIVEGMAITVTRVDIYNEYEYEAIPFDVIEHDNPRINFGTTVVTAEGEEGQRALTYEVTLRDGKLVSRNLVSDAVLKEPSTRIIERGTGGTIKLADGTVIPYKKRLEVICTAYTTERQTNKINAIGNIARVGTIAVDPKFIPLRSKVYVAAKNGAWVYGVALCEDTGGAIKGNIIDLYFDTWAECINFGRRSAYLYILD